MHLALIGFLPAYSWLVARNASECSDPWTTELYETELEALSAWSMEVPPIDLILLDGKPAILTATEVVQRLRQVPGGDDLRIAVCDPLPGEINELENNGVLCCMKSGFSPEETTSLLQRVAESKRAGVALAPCSCTIRTTALLDSGADCDRLRRIFQGSLWQLSVVHSVDELEQQMERGSPGVIITSPALSSGTTWHDVMNICGSTKVIVATSAPQRQLWAEALSLGAWDVLATPFTPAEVRRIVPSAWRAFETRTRRPAARRQLVASI